MVETTGLLLGADVGGTSTRVAVADRGGKVLGLARQPAGNPNAVGIDTSAQRIRAAIIDALRQAQGSEERTAAQGSEERTAAQGSEERTAAQGSEERTAAQGFWGATGTQGPSGATAKKGPELVEGPELKVDAIVLGMAGYGTAINAGTEFLTAALPAEVGCRARIVSDLAVGYASATALPRGYVVIAGTGSGAAELDNGEILARRGSWGWLLGDEGAGFWLGREAVRQALIEAERGLPYGALTRSVLDALRIGSKDPAEVLAGLIRVPYLQQPVRLADLAQIVTDLVDTDPAAASICARAADQLARLVLDLQPMPGRPIVAAGAVLQSPGPIRAAFAERLRQELAGPVLDARSGLAGALWLAAGTNPDGTARAEPPDVAVHERLLAGLRGA